MRIGIDLGTAMTRVAVPGKGVVLREPTVIADCGQLPLAVAVGSDARPIVGRTPAHIQAIRPVRHGVVGAPLAAREFVKVLLRQAVGWRMSTKPEVTVAVPTRITQAERAALTAAIMGSGVSRVHQVPLPVAAAHGADPQVRRQHAVMVLDIGAGTTEIAAVAPEIVIRDSLLVGGEDFDRALVAYLRANHSLEISLETAEKLKCSIGTAYPLGEPRQREISGRDMSSGLPGWVMVDSEQIRYAIERPLRQIAALARATLDNMPPALAPDVLQRGLVLTGAGAQLDGLDRFLAQELGVAVRVADNPGDCAALGSLEVKATWWRED